MTSFSAQSLLISVDTDVPANILTLTHPNAYEPHVSRKVFHEALHLWQLVSYPYLWSMAAEELDRFERFETTGEVLPPGLLRARFTQVDDEVGFSAESLHEAVARYWDVHVLGPALLLELEHRDPARIWAQSIESRYVQARDAGLLRRADGAYSSLAFDLAMEAAAGTYGEPYLKLRTTMNDRRAATLFPLVGALAFRSRKPTWLFLHLLTSCRDVEVDADDIHELWGRVWPLVCRTADDLLRERGERFDFSALALTHGRGPVSAVHRWLAAQYQRAADKVASTPDFDLDPKQAAELVALQFAVPGDPGARGFLVRHFPPPAVSMGASLWIPALQTEPDSSSWGRGTTPAELASQVQELHRRARAFTRASIHAGLPSPAHQGPEGNGVADLIDALLRVTDGRDLRVLQWLAEVLTGEAGEFGYFCVRHFRWLLDPDEARTAMDEIAYQLANSSALTRYDARRAVTRTWHGKPVELALATAALMLAGRKHEDESYAGVAAALHLRVLERLAGLDDVLPPAFDDLLGARVEALRCAVPPQSVIYVDDLIRSRKQPD